MLNFKKKKLLTADPNTDLYYKWVATTPDGKKVDWGGFNTGPLTLSKERIEAICQKLLGICTDEVEELAEEELQPVYSPDEMETSLVMHGTNPDLKSIEGDIFKLVNNIQSSDYPAYTETRATYLAKKGDMAVGRIKAWKIAAELEGLEAVVLSDLDHYYLSHALLLQAEQHLSTPTTQIKQIIRFLQKNKKTVVRLYAMELELQIFLLWLKQEGKLDQLLIDANSPFVAKNWNKKSVIYPPIKDALALTDKIKDMTPHQKLVEEAKYSDLYWKLGLLFPTFPGYRIERKGKSLEEFTKQLVQAAKLLRKRYQLERGCLKATESGDGSRINPGLDLYDTTELEALAPAAYQNGDDYLLEAHMTYSTINLGGQELKVAPSAHIRWGTVAKGLTLQMTDGTSWRGNIYVDEAVTASMGISLAQYQTIMDTMEAFRAAFHSRKLGLTIGGIDFALGRVGGVFGDEEVFGLQDPNISFNGAECLRVFMEKAKDHIAEPFYAATRVFCPSPDCTLPVLRTITDARTKSGTYAAGLAAVPGKWGMFAYAAKTPEEAVKGLFEIFDAVSLGVSGPV